MPRHIAWFTEAPVEPDPHGGLKTPHETVRRRCLLPARELENFGIPCSVFGNLRDAEPQAVARHLQKLATDTVVISHLTGPSLLALAQAVKTCGCDLIVDCDSDLIETASFAELARLADHLVAASPSTALLLAQRHLFATIIPDCDETGDCHAPSAMATLWLDCFKKLGMNLPPVANTNLPLSDNG